MDQNILVMVSIVINVIMLILLLIVMNMVSKQKSNKIQASLSLIEKAQERLERIVREDIGQVRQEMGLSTKQAREELTTLLNTLSQNVMTTINQMAFQNKNQLDSFNKQLTELTNMNEQKLEGVRHTVEQKLTYLQEDNSKKLEQMRLTVDEKLHATLEQRLGDSFKQVSERLEQVHKGLGEMQTLASGVGDLKKVLSNVKARGIMGEIQLGNLLEQILSPEQYESNVAMKKGSAERVEFAVKLPSKDDSGGVVYLPIDSKFPLEDYNRLLDAQELGDVQAAADAAKQLENRIKLEAKSIRDKYINPPNTTDFAVLFLPFEGLFAEVLRRPGLWDSLQRDMRIIIAGPTTLAAFLNSLQMGFRTLAIQKRSSEVWGLLGAVKTEFTKFGDILDKTKKKLQEASNTIDSAATRSRVIERKLKNVQELPQPETYELLGESELVGLE
ncbi:hypothetical protein M670_01811 [Schinkia azotoformans MEV2011]|uniref:DNA recombination protein RmuC n=1 Tax=Schinkia azotoformans MEV2011 TaxID=1348973 RepID=A0A072NMU5_SCHAZ|nr:DNA recombination protein RmuC [Schinkia azotoformans]KEF38994.1 hypothetical protein M670_01811 [Schinkia azotoformans MEV2011]MEC1694444.1 DNA recombination protein RmuC [Schinkia azotoformans]MEC1723255.1 DNA recombination protein RmuC [Schinkia azotoformans]MEC1772184.1 DNA recombination protein RmuC [Schinkia azotoformans]MEC1779124.1 DNA recombination protein RmuC [Schinkia azotoformans]